MGSTSQQSIASPTRSRIGVVALFVLSFVAIIAAGFAFRTRYPLAKISTLRIDIDSSAPSRLESKSFTITNAGAAVLDFRITKSCACSSVTPSSGQVSPGESQIVTVTQQSPSAVGGESSAMLQIQTNDAAHPSFAIRINSRVQSPFVLSSTYLDFGTISASAAPSPIQFHVTSPKFPERKIVVDCSSTDFHVSPNGEGFNVLPAINRKPRNNHATLSVYFEDSPEFAVRVPVRCRYAKPLSTSPHALEFCRNESGELQPVNLLVSASLDSPPLGSCRIENQSVQLEEVRTVTPRIKLYRVTCRANQPQPLQVQLLDETSGATCDIPLVVKNPKELP